jgi:hypothetical protein
MDPGCGRWLLNQLLGTSFLDMVDGAVAQIEVLYRDEIRRKHFATNFPTNLD